jgi:hypothetical protein
MKSHFLNNLEKSKLRIIAKNLGTPKADKLNKDKLISILSTHSYKDLKDALNK